MKRSINIALHHPGNSLCPRCGLIDAGAATLALDVEHAATIGQRLSFARCIATLVGTPSSQCRRLFLAIHNVHIPHKITAASFLEQKTGT